MQRAKRNRAFTEMMEAHGGTLLERKRTLLKELRIIRAEEAAAKARKCAANIEAIIGTTSSVY